MNKDIFDIVDTDDLPPEIVAHITLKKKKINLKEKIIEVMSKAGNRDLDLGQIVVAHYRMSGEFIQKRKLSVCMSALARCDPPMLRAVARGVYRLIEKEEKK